MSQTEELHQNEAGSEAYPLQIERRTEGDSELQIIQPARLPGTASGAQAFFYHFKPTIGELELNLTLCYGAKEGKSCSGDSLTLACIRHKGWYALIVEGIDYLSCLPTDREMEERMLTYYRLYKLIKLGLEGDYIPADAVGNLLMRDRAVEFTGSSNNHMFRRMREMLSQVSVSHDSYRANLHDFNHEVPELEVIAENLAKEWWKASNLFYTDKLDLLKTRSQGVVPYYFANGPINLSCVVFDPSGRCAIASKVSNTDCVFADDPTETVNNSYHDVVGPSDLYAIKTEHGTIDQSFYDARTRGLFTWDINDPYGMNNTSLSYAHATVRSHLDFRGAVGFRIATDGAIYNSRDYHRIDGLKGSLKQLERRFELLHLIKTTRDPEIRSNLLQPLMEKLACSGDDFLLATVEPFLKKKYE